MTRFPDDRAVIIILTNRGFGKQDKYVRDIAAMLFGEYKPPQEIKEVVIDRTILDRYVGEYEFAPGRTIIIGMENGRLTMQANLRPKRELIAVSETKFVLKVNTEAYITFERDSSGRITGLVLHEISSAIPAQKIR